MTYMPWAHSYTIQLNLIIYTIPWPRINGLCREEKNKTQPVHGPPLQARVVAANRAVLANCATILAHMAMNKGRGNAEQNRGKNDVGSGMAWQR